MTATPLVERLAAFLLLMLLSRSASNFAKVRNGSKADRWLSLQPGSRAGGLLRGTQHLKHSFQSLRKPTRLRAALGYRDTTMRKAIEYRGIAAKLRREAMATSLPQQRQLNLSAAARWEILAEEIEAVTAPAFPSLSQHSGWVM